MEDLATLRISSQHIANGLLHGVASPADVDAAFARMAATVDAKNAGDPLYEPMAGNPDSIALQAARALVFEGLEQPNGYTNPPLHSLRQPLTATSAPACQHLARTSKRRHHAARGLPCAGLFF